jgi:hypothetical protein
MFSMIGSLVLCRYHKFVPYLNFEVIARRATYFAHKPSIYPLIVEITAKKTVRTVMSPLFCFRCWLETPLRPFAQNSAGAHAVEAVVEWSQQINRVATLLVIVYDVAFHS